MFKRFLGGLLILAPIFSYAQNIDYSRIRNGPILSDGSFLSFASVCSGETTSLAVTKTWNAVGTQNCTRPMVVNGGVFQPAANAVLTISGAFTAPLTQVFDLSQSGSSVQFASGSVLVVYPQWFGAKGNNTNDDTAAIQAAINSCRGPINGGTYIATCEVRLNAGVYKTTAQLNLYDNTGTYRGMTFCGVSKYASEINYMGPANTSAIRAIGYFQKICDLHILNGIVTGWLDGIQYDGVNGLGISTGGEIEHIWIDCNGRPGNGISAGRSNFQADQLEISHPYIANCNQGIGVYIADANALSVHVVSPSGGHNWIGYYVVPSTNLFVTGGEIDDDYLNFYLSLGSQLSVTSVRSEGAERSFFSPVAAVLNSATFTGYEVATNTTTRPVTTAICVAGSPNITLSGLGYIYGDLIALTGCGTAGATLHAEITSMADATHAGLNANAETNQAAAAIALDAVQQYDFIEAGGGPYIHNGGFMNTVSGGAVWRSTVGATQVFNGVAWAENLANPFNAAATTACPTAAVSSPSWTGLIGNVTGAFTHIPDYVPGNGITPYLMKAVTGSANNALVVAGTNWCVPQLADGQLYNVYTGSFTLQAGANTLTIQDGNTPKSIKRHNGGGDLATPYPAGSMLQVMWSSDAFAYLDMSQ